MGVWGVGVFSSRSVELGLPCCQQTAVVLCVVVERFVKMASHLI